MAWDRNYYRCISKVNSVLQVGSMYIAKMQNYNSPIHIAVLSTHWPVPFSLQVLFAVNTSLWSSAALFIYRRNAPQLLPIDLQRKCHFRAFRLNDNGILDDAIRDTVG